MGGRLGGTLGGRAREPLDARLPCLSAIGGLAALQLGFVKLDGIVGTREGILATGNAPRGAVIGIPICPGITGDSGFRGGRTCKRAKARPAGLSGICSLAAGELSIIEGGGIDWVRSLTLAPGRGPRRAVIGVPFGSAGSRGGGDDGGAIPARLTTIVLGATRRLGVKPNLIAVGLVNTARHAPAPGIIGMPQGGGAGSAPGREQLALALLGLVVDGGDGGFGRRLVADETAQSQ